MGFFDLFRKKKKDAKETKYRLGMEKTRTSSISKLKDAINNHSKIDDELFDEIEEIFVMADIGLETVINFTDELRNYVSRQKITSPKELEHVIIDKMFDLYLKGEFVNTNLNVNKNGLSVYLFVGVNGSGKTTSIAKIAYKLINEHKKVLVAAGDTFRAAATEQLEVWGKRIGFSIIKGEENQDPSSVIFDAIKHAKEHNFDVLLCDTAGRLQTKANLMQELNKIKRVISREVENAPQDTLLVVDATTGQNGLLQAKAFLEATDVSGVILTKLDGTAKGGIVLGIRDVYKIPIKFVGLGEKMDDLEIFDIEKYIYGLFADFLDEE